MAHVCDLAAEGGYHQERLYLEADHTLGFVGPKGDYDVKAAAYVADPADPVPYRHRPVQSTYGEGSTVADVAGGRPAVC